MKNINVLLANAERRTNNLIDAVVLDVCYGQAVVKSTRISRVDELAHFGGQVSYDLIIVATDHLTTEPSRGSVPASTEEVVRAIQEIKRQRSIPLIALSVSSEDHVTLLEAGADGVLALPFKREALKSELRHVLKMTELVEEAEPARWSLAALFS